MEMANNNNNSTSWLKNAIKSVGSTVISEIKEVAPNISEVGASTIGTTTNLIQNMRKNKSSENRISKTLMNNKYMKFASTAMTNLMADLKSGNFNNDDRESGMDLSESDDESGDSGVSFGNEDTDGVSINVNSNNSAGFATISNQLNKNMEASIKMNKANMDAYIAVTSSSMLQTAKLGEQITSHLSNISNSIQALVEYNNTTMNKFITSSLAYYERLGSKIEGAIDDKLLSNDKVHGDSLIQGSKGGFNFADYKKYVVQEFKNSGLGSALKMMDDDMLKSIATNPLGSITKMVTHEIMPKFITQTLGGVERAFNTIVPVFLHEISGWAKDYSDGIGASIKRFIGSTFGIKSDLKKTVNTADMKLDTGPVPFDGRTRHTINNIITKELREQTQYLKIISNHYDKNATKSAISNSDVFDFKEKRWIKHSDINNNILEGYKKSIMSEFMGSALGDYFKKSVSKSGLSDKNAEALTKAMEQVFLNITGESNSINTRKKGASALFKYVDNINADDGLKNIIREVLEETYKVNPAAIHNINNTKIVAQGSARKYMKDLQENPDDYNFFQSSMDGKNMYNMLMDVYGLDYALVDKDGYYITDKNGNIKRTKRNNRKKLKLSGGREQISARESFMSNIKNLATEDGAGSLESAIFNLFSGDAGADGGNTKDRMKNSLKSRAKNIGSNLLTNPKAAASELGGLIVDQVSIVVDHINSKMGTSIGNYFLGEKNSETGKRTSGIFSPIINGLHDATAELKNKITGKEYIDSNGNKIPAREDSVIGEFKSLFKDIGTGVKNFIFGVKNGPDGEEKEGVLSSITNTLHEGLLGWKLALFGNKVDENGNPKSLDLDPDKIQETIRKYAPSAIVGSGAGFLLNSMISSGSGLLSKFAIGGPASALLGAGIGIAMRSERFQNFLFGEEVDGERTGGFISKQVQDYVKKNGAVLGIGATIGTLAGKGILSATSNASLGILGNIVGGPVIGALLGLGTVIGLKSKTFQEFIFGNEETGKRGVWNRLKSAIAKHQQGISTQLSSSETAVGMSLLGGGAGALAGFGLSKIGSIASMAEGTGLLAGIMQPHMLALSGALAGLTLTTIAQGKNIKTWLFGKKDETTGEKTEEGIFGKMGNMITATVLDPLKREMKYYWTDVKITVRDKILYPIERSVEPVVDLLYSLKDTVGVAVKGILGGLFNSVKGIGSSLVSTTATILKPVTSLVSHVVGGLIKSSVNIFSYPIRLTSKLLNAANTKIAKGLDFVKSSIEKGITTITDYVKEVVVDPIKNFIQNKLLKPVGRFLLKGLTAPFRLVGGLLKYGANKIGEKRREKRSQEIDPYDSKYRNPDGSLNEDKYQRALHKRDTRINKDERNDERKHNKNEQLLGSVFGWNKEYMTDTEENRQRLLEYDRINKTHYARKLDRTIDARSSNAAKPANEQSAVDLNNKNPTDYTLEDAQTRAALETADSTERIANTLDEIKSYITGEPLKSNDNKKGSTINDDINTARENKEEQERLEDEAAKNKGFEFSDLGGKSSGEIAADIRNAGGVRKYLSNSWENFKSGTSVGGVAKSLGRGAVGTAVGAGLGTAAMWGAASLIPGLNAFAVPAILASTIAGAGGGIWKNSDDGDGFFKSRRKSKRRLGSLSETFRRNRLFGGSFNYEEKEAVIEQLKDTIKQRIGEIKKYENKLSDEDLKFYQKYQENNIDSDKYLVGKEKEKEQLKKEVSELSESLETSSKDDSVNKRKQINNKTQEIDSICNEIIEYLDEILGKIKSINKKYFRKKNDDDSTVDDTNIGNAQNTTENNETTVDINDIPHNAKGTLNAKPGLALVGEKGPEVVSFGGGEQVIPYGRSVPVTIANVASDSLHNSADTAEIVAMTKRGLPAEVAFNLANDKGRSDAEQEELEDTMDAIIDAKEQADARAKAIDAGKTAEEQRAEESLELQRKQDATMGEILKQFAIDKAESFGSKIVSAGQGILDFVKNIGGNVTSLLKLLGLVTAVAGISDLIKNIFGKNGDDHGGYSLEEVKDTFESSGGIVDEYGNKTPYADEVLNTDIQIGRGIYKKIKNKINNKAEILNDAGKRTTQEAVEAGTSVTDDATKIATQTYDDTAKYFTQEAVEAGTSVTDDATKIATQTYDDTAKYFTQTTNGMSGGTSYATTPYSVSYESGKFTVSGGNGVIDETTKSTSSFKLNSDLVSIDNSDDIMKAVVNGGDDAFDDLNKVGTSTFDKLSAEFVDDSVKELDDSGKGVLNKIIEGLKSFMSGLTKEMEKRMASGSLFTNPILKKIDIMLGKIVKSISDFFNKIKKKALSKFVNKFIAQPIQQAISVWTAKKTASVATSAAITSVAPAVGLTVAGVKFIMDHVWGFFGALDRGTKAGAAKLFQIDQKDVDPAMQVISGLFGFWEFDSLSGAILCTFFSIYYAMTDINILWFIAMGIYMIVNAFDKEKQDEYISAWKEFDGKAASMIDTDINSQYDTMVELGTINPNEISREDFYEQRRSTVNYTDGFSKNTYNEYYNKTPLDKALEFFTGKTELSPNVRDNYKVKLDEYKDVDMFFQDSSGNTYYDSTGDGKNGKYVDAFNGVTNKYSGSLNRDLLGQYTSVVVSNPRNLFTNELAHYDINDDGKIDETDYAELMDIIINQGYEGGYTTDQTDWYDTDRDGYLTTKDISLYKDYLAHGFPAIDGTILSGTNNIFFYDEKSKKSPLILIYRGDLQLAFTYPAYLKEILNIDEELPLISGGRNEYKMAKHFISLNHTGPSNDPKRYINIVNNYESKEQRKYNNMTQYYRGDSKDYRRLNENEQLKGMRYSLYLDSKSKSEEPTTGEPHASINESRWKNMTLYYNKQMRKKRDNVLNGAMSKLDSTRSTEIINEWMVESKEKKLLHTEKHVCYTDPITKSFFVRNFRGDNYSEFTVNGSLLRDDVTEKEVYSQVIAGAYTSSELTKDEYVKLMHLDKLDLEDYKNKYTFTSKIDLLRKRYEANVYSSTKQKTEDLLEMTETNKLGLSRNNIVWQTGQGEGVRGGGYGTDTLNNFAYYSQNDTRWGNMAYPQLNGYDGATMGTSGCGPTAMSMVISQLGKTNVNPVDMAGVAQATGYRDDTGTNWNFIDAASSMYGIPSIRTYGPSASNIASSLDSGNPMILSGVSDGSGTPYTKAGHYIVAVGRDSNGNVIVNDPRGKSYSKHYNINSLANMTDVGWSFMNGGFGPRKVSGSRKARRGGRGYGNDYRALIVAIAKSQIGNVGGKPYWSSMGYSSRVEWCAAFVTWCAKTAGVPGNVIKRGAGAGDNRGFLNSKGRFNKATSGYIPQTGDLIFYFPTDDNGNYMYSNYSISSHIGIVEGIDENGNVLTVEGNTNDDRVARHSYPLSKAEIQGYGTPDYDSITTAPPAVDLNAIAQEGADLSGTSITTSDSGISTGNSKPSLLSALSSFASEYSNRLVTGMLSGNYDSDFSGFVSNLLSGTNDEVSSDDEVTAGSVSLNGDGSEEKAWNYLRSKGMPSNGVAGLMGNLYAESGLNPINLENSANNKGNISDKDFTTAVDNGSITRSKFMSNPSMSVYDGGIYGYGLAQWTSSGRKGNMYDFIKKKKKLSIGDLGGQLEFLYNELKNNYPSVYETLMNSSSSLKEASDDVLLHFEVPADQSDSMKNTRASYGKSYYDMFANKPVSGTKLPNGRLGLTLPNQSSQGGGLGVGISGRRNTNRLKHRGGRGTGTTYNLSSYSNTYGSSYSSSYGNDVNRFINNQNDSQSSTDAFMKATVKLLYAIAENTHVSSDKLSFLEDLPGVIGTTFNNSSNTILVNDGRKVKTTNVSNKTSSSNSGPSRNALLAKQIARG